MFGLFQRGLSRLSQGTATDVGGAVATDPDSVPAPDPVTDDEDEEQRAQRMRVRGSRSREDGRRKKSRPRGDAVSQARRRLPLDSADDGDDDDDADFPAPLAVKAKETRAPRGIFDENLEKDWGPDVTQKKARDSAQSFEGCSWLSAGSKSGQVDYKCASHENCPRKLRLVYKGSKDNQLGAKLYSNGQDHSAIGAREPFRGRGVGGEFVEEIKLLKSAGLGAAGIHIRLRKKYGQDPETKDDAKVLRLPTRNQIQAYINTNLHSADELLSNAELLSLVTPMLVQSWDDIQTRNANEVLVLQTFCRTVDIPVLDEEGNPTAKATKETTIGFVTANRAMLEWHRDFLISHAENPRPFTLMITSDGTYRLCKGNTKAGAVLVDLGMHDITYDQSNNRDTHNFLPLLYMYCQTECFEAYRQLFATLKTLPEKFLNLPNRQIRPVFGSLDRAYYIANAYLDVWPRVVLETEDSDTAMPDANDEV
mmetsp:Transcript_2849/g.9481  ORF Transcript_2849/g.9481 Transcript_2849/m.9481 type:complete len:480 (-) Transcript_2849:1781-3220(-)